jgi:prevent-host-death family protein
MGLREANQQFSKAIQAVKAGEEVVLTERGRPIAVIKPLARATSVGAVIRQFEAAGLLRAAANRGPMPPWRPRLLKREPISDTIRGERDER